NEVAFTAYEGYSQFLYYTKDGGETWLRSAFYLHSNDMNIVTSGKIYASGYYYDSTSNGGYIYNSDNYGRDWHVIDTEFEMKKVRNVNSKTAIAISNYEVYRSTDSGNSWFIVLSSNDYFNYYSNFAF